MILATTDWTLVLAAAVSAVPATLAAVLAALNRRELKTPNGAKLGELVSHTHDLAEVAATEVQKVVSGEVERPHGANNETGGKPNATQARPEND